MKPRNKIPVLIFCYFAGIVHDTKGNIIKLDNGTVLEYLPWKVSLDITDTPYEQTAGARMKSMKLIRLPQKTVS